MLESNCDYRKSGCTNQGLTIDGAWFCVNHLPTEPMPASAPVEQPAQSGASEEAVKEGLARLAAKTEGEARALVEVISCRLGFGHVADYAPQDRPQAPMPTPQPVPLVERMIEAYRKHRLDPSPVPAMTAALRVALDEALGRETRDELSTFRQRLNGVRGGFDVALEFFIKDRRDRLLAPAAPVDPAVEAIQNLLIDYHCNEISIDAAKIVAAVDQARAAGGGKK